MNRLTIDTRGIGSWRARLASPDQMVRAYSAFETAVSWERASETPSGLPEPIAALLYGVGFTDPVLLLAIAEHRVDLPGGRAASQCDVWALVKTGVGTLSLAVEAKAKEAFGNEILGKWLEGTGSAQSKINRKQRWNFLLQHLPKAKSYSKVRYQLLHRSAAAVIEAKRCGCQHAAMVVQAFGPSAKAPNSFRDYAAFCGVLGVTAKRGGMSRTSVGEISLSVGWVDCPLATDEDVARVA